MCFRLQSIEGQNEALLMGAYFYFCLAGVYGAFLLACYDEDREEFQSICKIGKLVASYWPFKTSSLREDNDMHPN